MSIKRNPFPQSFLPSAYTPDHKLDDICNASLPILRHAVNLQSKDDVDRVSELAGKQNKNVQEFVDSYVPASPEAGKGIQVYKLLDVTGTKLFSMIGRESLEDGPQLRAFDYVWTNRHHLDKVDVDYRDLPFDRSRSGNPYIIPENYIKLHAYLCHDGCGNEWHPRVDQVINVIGNLGADDAEQFGASPKRQRLDVNTHHESDNDHSDNSHLEHLADLANASLTPNNSPDLLATPSTRAPSSLLTPPFNLSEPPSPLLASFSAQTMSTYNLDSPTRGMDMERGVPITPRNDGMLEHWQNEVQTSEQ